MDMSGKAAMMWRFPLVSINTLPLRCRSFVNINNNNKTVFWSSIRKKRQRGRCFLDTARLQRQLQFHDKLVNRSIWKGEERGPALREDYFLMRTVPLTPFGLPPPRHCQGLLSVSTVRRSSRLLLHPLWVSLGCTYKLRCLHVTRGKKYKHLRQCLSAVWSDNWSVTPHVWIGTNFHEKQTRHKNVFSQISAIKAAEPKWDLVQASGDKRLLELLHRFVTRIVLFYPNCSMATLPSSCRGPPECEQTRELVPPVLLRSRCRKWPTNQCLDSRSASGVGDQEWLLSDLTDHFFSLFTLFENEVTEKTTWVIIFILLRSQACFRADIFQDSRSCVEGNDSVVFNLVLFPLRDAPGCSPIRPFDSHKLTHAETFRNSNNLCNFNLILCEVRKHDFAEKWMTMSKCNHRTKFCFQLKFTRISFRPHCCVNRWMRGQCEAR